MIILKTSRWLFWIEGLVRKLQAGVCLKSILCILGIRISSVWRAGCPKSYTDHSPRFQFSDTNSDQKNKPEVDRASHDTVGAYDFIHSGECTDFSTKFYRKMDSRKKSREHISVKTSKNVLQTYCNDLDSTEFACFALSSRYPRSMPKII